MKTEAFPPVIVVGEWHATRATGELRAPGGSDRLEPKVMDLLFLLASRPGEALSKDDIMNALWPDVVVGDDTLARSISRLRKALGDDPKTPRFIETLPKRGYRLIAPVGGATKALPNPPVLSSRSMSLASSPTALGVASLCVLFLVLLVWSFLLPAFSVPPATGPQLVMERANDFYFQFKRADNEAAIELFDRLLTDDPDYSPALAGLANALVQKTIRWSGEVGSAEYTKLGDALKSGRVDTPAARRVLSRAQALATRAVSIAPNDAAALKALGFVQSAKREFAAALATYEKAIVLDNDSWGVLINIADVLEISGQPEKALPYFERAYDAMTRVYDKQATRVRPWYAELGVLIGDRYRAAAKLQEAETWYRRVLSYAPLHPAATANLAGVLRQTDRQDVAEELCRNLERRVGQVAACAS